MRLRQVMIQEIYRAAISTFKGADPAPWAKTRRRKSAGFIKSPHARDIAIETGQDEDKMTATGANYQDRLNRVATNIYDHLDGDLDFASLAEVAAMSPYHWRRIYHAVRGETAIPTAKRLRLKRAAVDLAQSARSIEEVAERAGYGGVPAFTRA
jgi:transcriptional regulator GlxA family with amidase domain